MEGTEPSGSRNLQPNRGGREVASGGRLPAKERAEGLLDLLLRYGSTHIRSHCNVDPVVGLRNLEATLQAVEGYREKAFVEIVAFHSMACFAPVRLFGQGCAPERSALVGGLDPTTVDENMENH